MAFTEKYVSVAGGGSHDGSSEANAWTFEEAIAAPVGAGNRVNVKVGTHTLTASRTLPSGTTENPIEWRGYNSTIGDLETVGRATATGELDDTNFPLIDCGASYALTSGAYNSLRTLAVTGSGNVSLLILGTAPNVYRVRSAQTSASGASAKCITAAGVYGSVLDCDFLIASTNASAVACSVGRSAFIGCRTWHTGTPNAASVGYQVSDVGSCLAESIVYNFGTGIVVGGFNGQVFRNTVYGCVDGVRLGDGGAAIAENIIYSMSGYGIKGVASSGNSLLLNNAMGALTSGRIDTSTAGSIIEEVGAVTLTGDPFTNAASRDFTLNNTSGAGALCRAASKLFGGQRDLGAVQTQAASGGGAPSFGPLSMSGPSFRGLS